MTHLLKWLYPGLNIKRWLLLLSGCAILITGGLAVVFTPYLKDLFILFASDLDRFMLIGGVMIAFGVYVGAIAAARLSRSLSYVLLGEDGSSLIDLIFLKRKLLKGAAITVVGGGTGLASLLRGIKHISGNCTAVVAVTDDGGSSGRLRAEFGTIPTGDLRSCITALADTEPLMSELLQYRFKEDSSLAGHSFGNLFITAMAEVAGDMEKGLNAANNILKVRGNVLPASLENVRLAAKLSDGRVIEGETDIAAAGQKIERLMLTPAQPAATKSAVEAILNADLLVVGPGSLYSSVITNLLIPDIKKALLKSRAVKIYICNVMTQPGETDGYTAYDHVRAVYDHVGESFFDFVVVNKQKINAKSLCEYAQKGAYPVKNTPGLIKALGAGVVEADLLSKENLVRHDPLQLAKTLNMLLYRLRLSGSGNRFFDYYFVKGSLKKTKAG